MAELNEAATLQEQIGKHRPNDKVKLMIKKVGFDETNRGDLCVIKQVRRNSSRGTTSM